MDLISVKCFGKIFFCNVFVLSWICIFFCNVFLFFEMLFGFCQVVDFVSGIYVFFFVMLFCNVVLYLVLSRFVMS